jgi:regulator of cell morphogenesis and NO signaling
MTPTIDQTVREIAVNNPATVRVFESLGIDYCCGGKRPLREACDRANVPVAQVLGLLADLKPESISSEQIRWADASLLELTEHIVARHHSYIRQEAPRLEMLLDKVVSRHGDAHKELFSIRDLYSAMSQELFAHLLKEEQVLFPFLQKIETAADAGTPLPSACFESIGVPIARMLADHDDAGELTARIRALSGNYEAPDGACPSYRGLYYGLKEFERDLHRHVHLENNILFPRALEMERTLRQDAVYGGR